MFNNGYNSLYPALRQTGLLAGLKGKLNWSSILTNTQKTLNIVNQAIPLVYQIRPIIDNAKTVFKIIGAVKEEDTPNNITKNSNNINHHTTTTKSSNVSNVQNSYQSNRNQPNFFL